MRIASLSEPMNSAGSGLRAASRAAQFHLPGTGAGLRPAATPAPSGLVFMPLDIPDPGERRRRALKQGRGLLDALDQVRAALLVGGDAREGLNALAAAAPYDTEEQDTGLRSTLREIHIRAEVEVAKAEVRALNTAR